MEIRTPRQYDLVTTDFRESSIVFPNGYYFRHSAVKAGSEIAANRISEINTNTEPPSFVLDDREIIFMKYEDAERLMSFAVSNHIPVVARPDIWGLLYETILDNAYREGSDRPTLRALWMSGLTKREVTAVINHIRNRRRFAVFFVGDYEYLGQYDYLVGATFLSKRRYWWSMTMALRNFSRQKRPLPKENPHINQASNSDD